MRHRTARPGHTRLLNLAHAREQVAAAPVGASSTSSNSSSSRPKPSGVQYGSDPTRRYQQQQPRPLESSRTQDVQMISQRAQVLEQERIRLGKERRRIENELRSLRQGRVVSDEDQSKVVTQEASAEEQEPPSPEKPSTLQALQAYFMGRIDDENAPVPAAEVQSSQKEATAASNSANDDAEFRRQSANAVADLFGEEKADAPNQPPPPPPPPPPPHPEDKPRNEGPRVDSPPPEPRQTMPPPPSPAPIVRTQPNQPSPHASDDECDSDDMATHQLMLAAHQRAARHRGSESSSVPAVGSIVAVHSGATGARAMIETVRQRGVCRGHGKPLAAAEGWDRVY